MTSGVTNFFIPANASKGVDERGVAPAYVKQLLLGTTAAGPGGELRLHTVL